METKRTGRLIDAKTDLFFLQAFSMFFTSLPKHIGGTDRKD